MADALDSKSSAARRVGSSPTLATSTDHSELRATRVVRSFPSHGRTRMTDAEQRLLELLKARSFKRAPAGEPFTLASGAKSEYFIDGKMTAVCSEGADLIGEVLYKHTKDARIDAIGGLQVGAIPLTTAAVIAYNRHGRPIEGFWVREAVKTHGTQKKIEGGLRKGMRVAVVDDVFTKGGSTLKAV